MPLDSSFKTFGQQTMADQPPSGPPEYGPCAAMHAPALYQNSCMDFDWSYEQDQASLNQLAPPVNYGAWALQSSFDTNHWPPYIRGLQSRSYALSDGGYESVEYQEGYRDSDSFPCSATDHSTSQAGSFSDYDLPRSRSSSFFAKPNTSIDTLPDIRRLHTTDDAQSNAGHTAIDSLMLAIQSSSAPTSNLTHLASFPNKTKKYTCTHNQCSKSFSQRSQLLVHDRSHSGEKPYLCGVPCCGQRFSQVGNFKTHERRHCAKTHFSCKVPGCGKRFSVRSSLRSHCGSVHSVHPTSLFSGSTPANFVEGRNMGLRELSPRFECRLDGCATNSDFTSGTGKPFTQLGNLKAHQNKFHVDRLRGLECKFATLIFNTGGADAALSVMDDEDRELWRYFGGLYQNCNKGIKGRGKGRKVAA